MKIKLIIVVTLLSLIFVLLNLLNYSSNPIEYLLLIPGFLIGVVLAVFIHELGHLVFGLISNYKFISFRVMGLLFYKDKNIKVKFEPTSIIFLGQCLMAPSDRRYFLYNIGGLVFTYIFSIILLILFYLSNSYLAQFVFGIFFVNTFLGINNSIYSKYGINDISNIIKCKNELFLEGMLYQLDCVGNIVNKNKITSKYNPKDDVLDTLSNISIWKLKYYKYYNEKNLDKVNYYYDLLSRSYNSIYIPVIKISVLSILLNHDFIIKNDISSIKRRFNRISSKEYNIFKRYKSDFKLVDFYKKIIIEKIECSDEFIDKIILKGNDILSKIHNDIHFKVKRVYKYYLNHDFTIGENKSV